MPRTQISEETRVRAAMERYLPSVKELVKSYKIEFKENFAGEPAVYVTLRITRPDDAKPKVISRLLEYWQKVRREILSEDATYFPYVTIVGTSRR